MPAEKNSFASVKNFCWDFKWLLKVKEYVLNYNKNKRCHSIVSNQILFLIHVIRLRVRFTLVEINEEHSFFTFSVFSQSKLI